MRKKEIIEQMDDIRKDIDFARTQRLEILDAILDVTNTFRELFVIISNRLDALESKVFGKKPRPAK